MRLKIYTRKIRERTYANNESVWVLAEDGSHPLSHSELKSGRVTNSLSVTRRYWRVTEVPSGASVQKLALSGQI